MEETDEESNPSQQEGTKGAQDSALGEEVVRVVAVRVLGALVASEKVKTRRCLCRLAEALVDSGESVQRAAVEFFSATLNEVHAHM